jgi:hypothetical protein
MSEKSEYLDRIISRQNRTATLKVVFVDVQSYSKRRSQAQVSVIDAFMECLSKALKTTSQKYIEYTQANDMNFHTDIIVLPSGDGAAIAFPFEGLHDIHLFFAVNLLEEVKKNNDEANCDKFRENGWCNCHNSFNLCVGISEGKGILYKDINDSYNIAGNVINIAARVMGKAEANQIIFTEEAYRQLIDMVDDPNLDDEFREYTGVNIKHDLKINVYQYIASNEAINPAPPEDLVFAKRSRELLDTLGQISSQKDEVEGFDKMKLLGMLEAVTKVFSPSSQMLDIKSSDEEEKE